MRESAYSNTVRLGIDVSAKELDRRAQASGNDLEFRIEGTTDGKTWEPNMVRIGPDACVSLWVRGLPGGLGTRDVNVRINGRELPSVFVSEPDTNGLRQVNALLPVGLTPGAVDINVAVEDLVTSPVQVELVSSSGA